jgi:hypothetical protein
VSKYLSTVRYAGAQTGVNFEKILTWGAIFGGLFLAYKVYSGVKAVTDAAGNAINTVGSAIGSGLFRMFGPEDRTDSTYYMPVFPDGKSHAVPASRVNAAGRFTNSNLTPNYPGDGRLYQLVLRKSDNKRYAVLA